MTAEEDPRSSWLLAVSTLAFIARGIALALSAPCILGFLWFSDSFDATWLAYWFTSIPCMVIAPILPRRFFYPNLFVRLLVILACSSSILLTLPIMHFDLALVNGADYPAFMMRCIQTGALAALILEAAIYPRMETRNQRLRAIGDKSPPSAPRRSIKNPT